MEQNFRRAHQTFLATTCQLCCTWTTSLNSIKQPCRCNQGRDLFYWDLHYWDLYCVCLQSSPGFGFNIYDKQHMHTPQDARDQVTSCITLFFFKKVHLAGTAFPNEVTPCRCADFRRPRKAELDGNPNRAAGHGTVIHHLIAMNRHSCLWKCSPSHISVLQLLLNVKDKAFYLLLAFSYGQHYCSVITHLWVTK